ncbi:hypothetical protein DFQ28_007936 [Apophysomyces sp. BC1034]|nr:hypothetical protein DFQ30_010892 [Apophysomyces sp. BC1015]KAG0186383.1 hypothetical protein DFQ28_007936 [Apophysomyces sp. BC1034]
MSIRIVRLGSPRDNDEGLRIGTVRRPPRGVPKVEFARRDYYDVWLPILSPDAHGVTQAKSAQSQAEWNAFARTFRAAMNAGDASKVLDVLAALSKSTNFSIGCYCEDESRCHRSILRELLNAARRSSLEPGSWRGLRLCLVRRPITAIVVPSHSLGHPIKVRRSIMKSMLYATVAASILATPLASLAQTNAPLTRAQVRAELVQLEKAGYQPGLTSPYYPNDIQAAEARLHAQDTSVGDVAAGAARSAPGATAVSSRAGGPANEINSAYSGQ